MTSLSERVAEANRLKAEGNAKMAEKDYKGAVVAYKKVFLYTRGLDVSRGELGTYAASLGKQALSPEQESEVYWCIYAYFMMYIVSFHSLAPLGPALQVAGLVVAVCSNLSLAYLNLTQYDKVVQYGMQVCVCEERARPARVPLFVCCAVFLKGLRIDPNNLKLLVRVGQAYHLLGDLSKYARTRFPACCVSAVFVGFYAA